MSLAPGTHLCDYEIQHFIGNGSMGEVYKARDVRHGRDVAIKLIAQHTNDPDRLTLLQREAKLAAALLRHPGIAALYAVESQGDDLFFAVEYVEGRPLTEVIRPHGLPLVELLRIGMAVAEAIAAGHEHGILHHGIKPANVMVTQDGHVKVLDFALGKLRDIVLPDHFTCSTDLLLERFAYSPPEQIQCLDLDGRSDVFSLGVLLYEMATGRSPFLRETWAAACSAVLGDPPRPVAERRPDLPGRLGKILERALAKERGRRYKSVKDLARALERLEPKPNVVLTWFKELEAKLLRPRG